MLRKDKVKLMDPVTGENYKYSFEPYDPIGEGSCASVFLGENLTTGKYVAIKRMSVITEKDYKACANEIKIMTKLSGPEAANIVQIEAAKNEDRQLSLGEFHSTYAYIAMTFGEENLGDLLDPEELLSLPLQLVIMRGILNGVVYIHAQGIIHRDLKPDNIVVNGMHQGKPIPLICDFGSSISSDHQDYVSVGTPHFMAPEQLCGLEERTVSDEDKKLVFQTHTEKSDVYACAAILWALSTGNQAPYSDYTNTEDLIDVICYLGQRPRITAEIDPAIAPIIERGWKQKPEERPTAIQMHKAINSLFFETNKKKRESECELAEGKAVKIFPRRRLDLTVNTSSAGEQAEANVIFRRQARAGQ